MIITNDDLSADGFTITSGLGGTGILPQCGNDLCLERLFQDSPKPELLGNIPDLNDFSKGVDIDVHGMQIKKSGSNAIFVPKELSPFFGTIRACVDNEYRIDPNAADRRFVITITRSDTIFGQAHRNISGAGEWHVHLPSVRFYRAKKIPVTRVYTAADFCGTECLVGPRSALGNLPIPDNFIEVIAEGKIGVFTSFTIHRSPVPVRTGRRTVFILSSRSPKSEETFFCNPMSSRLFGVDDKTRNELIGRWKETEIAINVRTQPTAPAKIVPANAIVLAA